MLKLSGPNNKKSMDALLIKKIKKATLFRMALLINLRFFL
jgi:hypothetical protein